MPDPLSNLEIQDVLSSIRRLVSEDNRHRAERERARGGAGDAGEAPAEDAPVAGKLVLTAALRVPGAEEPEAGIAAPDAAAGEGEPLDRTVSGEGRFAAESVVPAVAETELAGGDTWEAAEETAADAAGDDVGMLEGRIAELEAAVAGISGEFEPDGSEVARSGGIDAELEEAFEDGFAVDTGGQDEAAELAHPVTSGAIGSEADDDFGNAVDSAPAGDTMGAAEAPDDDASDSSDEATTAEYAGDDADAADPAQEATTAEWTGDDADAADPAHEAATAEGAGAAGALLLTEQVADRPDTDTAEAPWANLPAATVPAFVHSATAWRDVEVAPAAEPARPAGLRRLTLTAADAVPDSPAEGSDDASAAEPDAGMMVTDAAGDGAALAEDMADRSLGEGEDEGSIFGPGDEGPVDMAMLRDLVAEILREELQGPLGERITRNVRMLVRREISRALGDRSNE